jgi:hypothetical protein
LAVQEFRLRYVQFVVSRFWVAKKVHKIPIVQQEILEKHPPIFLSELVAEESAGGEPEHVDFIQNRLTMSQLDGSGNVHPGALQRPSFSPNLSAALAAK